MKVSAIVWYGDPRFVAGEPVDKGTSQTSGVSIMAYVPQTFAYQKSFPN